MSKNIKFEDYKDKIAAALKAKGIKCGSCQQLPASATIVEAFINLPLQKEITGSLVIGGPSLPLVAIVCNNCGSVQYYALKALIKDIEL